MNDTWDKSDQISDEQEKVLNSPITRRTVERILNANPQLTDYEIAVLMQIGILCEHQIEAVLSNTPMLSEAEKEWFRSVFTEMPTRPPIPRTTMQDLVNRILARRDSKK